MKAPSLERQRRRQRFRAWALTLALPGLIAATLVSSDHRGFAASPAPQTVDPTPLPGTEALTMSGDIASNLVAGVDRFLLRKIDESTARRAQFWHRDFSSPAAYNLSVETNRARLAHLLGVRDSRVANPQLTFPSTPAQSALVGRTEAYEIHAVTWPAFGDVTGEGLLVTPTRKTGGLRLVAIPDADQTPEQLVGLQGGIAPESQFARRLAESGCQVLVPTLIDRNKGPHKGRARLTAREFLYRPAFELGRHLIGYEVQKVLAAVDWFSSPSAGSTGTDKVRIGVFGWGEGGMMALYAGALDTRIAAVGVSGYFDDRRRLWEQPIDRSVFGLFEQFGDAELASLILPRPLVIEAARGPELVISGEGGGAPARLQTPRLDTVQREVERVRELTGGFAQVPLHFVVSSDGTGPYGSTAALSHLLAGLSEGTSLAELGPTPENLRANFDPKVRQARQLHEIDRHNQFLLTQSPLVRQEFMKNLNTKSLEQYSATVEPYRKFFYDEVIGRFDDHPLPFNPRTRKAYDEAKWTGYEVVLDVFPDVIAYGLLLLPKDLKPDERRPVVVCQHGLEGRPQNIVTGDHEAYHDFAAKLAERGFITFSPQNLYIFTDRFRSLQRKSYPLKKTLFSTIVPQHQQIVDWLETLPFVDPKRIAFYGLSYGGKSAMRIPPLVPEYVLSICSADFNEWVAKNAATEGTIGRYSYVWGGEYEIFEFDLGSTFNYAEMAALIAPRPFMVERGHFDGVAPDETVGYEFGKVRFLYAARLGIGDRCELETFVGPHTIHGQGTFDFLHKHLNWPKP